MADISFSTVFTDPDKNLMPVLDYDKELELRYDNLIALKELAAELNKQIEFLNMFDRSLDFRGRPTLKTTAIYKAKTFLGMDAVDPVKFYTTGKREISFKLDELDDQKAKIDARIAELTSSWQEYKDSFKKK